MSNKARNTSGKFASKSETPRKIRSVNLTDDAWQWLAEVAAQAGVSRNDYLEALAEGNNPLMEMVKAQALSLMETVETETKADSGDTTQQSDSEAFPLMEMVEVYGDGVVDRDDRYLELQADVGWVEQELLEVRGDCNLLKEQLEESRQIMPSS